MSAPPPARAHRGNGLRRLAWLLVLAALAAAGWHGWQWWQRHGGATSHAESVDAAAMPTEDQVRLAGVEDHLDRLRRAQHALEQRQQDAGTRQQVLREEVLGIGERAALLEDTIQRANAERRSGQQAVRGAEIELLLSMGTQRMLLFGDVAGAQHAYALAEQALTGVDDPAYLNLRQTLAQERAALAALPDDPRVRAGTVLDALQAALPTLPVDRAGTAVAGADSDARLERLLARLVQVRRSDPERISAAADRDAALIALQVEITLARAALERRDQPAFGAALARIERWLTRLYAASPARQALVQRLHDVAALPLQQELPTLGSSLEQLRSLRAIAPSLAPPVELPAPPPAAPPLPDADGAPR